MGFLPGPPAATTKAGAASLGFLSSRGSSGGGSSLCKGPGLGVQSAPPGKVETEEGDHRRPSAPEVPVRCALELQRLSL